MRYESIRMAAAGDLSKIAVYASYACDVHLKISLDGYDIALYDLSSLHWLNPEPATENGRTTLVMPEVNSDLLYVATRRGGRAR